MQLPSSIFLPYDQTHVTPGASDTMLVFFQPNDLPKVAAVRTVCSSVLLLCPYSSEKKALLTFTCNFGRKIST